MPHETTFLQLPGGARICRVEMSGAISGEDARTFLRQTQPGGTLYGMPLLVLLQKVSSLSSEARGVIGKVGREDIEPWEAVVVTNPVVRVTANFVIRMQGRKRTKLFPGEPEALQWLDARVREEASGRLPVGGDPGSEGEDGTR